MHYTQRALKPLVRSSRAASALRQTLGLERITTVEVSHRTKCFGIIFQHEEGWSIV
jgi:ribonuclease Z